MDESNQVGGSDNVTIMNERWEQPKHTTYRSGQVLSSNVCIVPGVAASAYRVEWCNLSYPIVSCMVDDDDLWDRRARCYVVNQSQDAS